MARMGRLAFDHALQLHEDLIHLWERGSYGSALALSVLAAEEIGKYVLLEELVYRAIIGSSWYTTKDEQREYLQKMYDHRTKQTQFGQQAEMSIPAALLEHVYGGGLERDKQRALYVGLPRRGKSIDMDARVIAPQYTGKKQAARQITTVSDTLLVLAVGTAKGYQFLDLDEVHDMMTLRLARALREWWPHIGRPAYTYVRKVHPAILTSAKRKKARRGRKRD